MFVLAFENEEERSSFNKYCTPTVEIKDYNVLIDQQPFYEIPIKNKEETYKATIEKMVILQQYFIKYYKLFAIDLSKKRCKFEIQQINFICKLEQDAIIFFIIEEKHQTRLKCS